MPVFTSSIEVTADYPTIKPSLNLNFARSRSLDPRITFTRASVGTYVGRDGLIKTAGNDKARFDHDPETLESLGLLIEESRTNFALDSNDYSINTTTINASITTNVITAPDGTLTADMITASAGNAQHGSTKNTTGLPINSVCSLSIFVKAGTNNYCRLDEANVTNWSASSSVVVNLTNGSIISGSGTVEPYPNGWYRITIYPTSNSTAGVSRGMWVWVCGSNGNSTYNAVGTETIHVWGTQIEAGSFPTSCIPTSGSSVTRVADVGNITGDAFSSFYNTTEGVLQTEFSRIGSVFNQMVVQLKDSDGSERIEIRGQSSTNDSFRMEVIEGDATGNPEYRFSGSVVANVVGQFAKVNLAYKQNDFASTINGTIASTDNAGDVGVCDRVGIGYANYGIGYNGHIKNIIYYPKRLTNAQLQLLTS